MNLAEKYLSSAELAELNARVGKEGRAPNIIELLENYETYLRNHDPVPALYAELTDTAVRFMAVTEDDDGLPVRAPVVIYVGDIKKISETRGDVPLDSPGTYVHHADGACYLSDEKIRTWENLLETELRASIGSIKQYR